MTAGRGQSFGGPLRHWATVPLASRPKWWRGAEARMADAGTEARPPLLISGFAT